MQIIKNSVSFMILICTTVFIVSCSENQVQLLFENKSEETIIKATISVSDQLMEFNNIAPGGMVASVYKIKNDSHYVVDVEFKSGRSLQKELGYITRGFNYKHKISVTGMAIQLVENKIE